MNKTNLSNSIFYFSKKYLFILLFGVLLNACSGLQTAQDYLLNNDEGLVFFSMTESGIFAPYQLTFVNESTQHRIAINLRETDQLDIGLNNNKMPAVRSYANPRGKLIVLRLPEGVYQFDKWSSTGAKKLGKHSLGYSPAKKFRVMNGGSLYLGNVHLVSSESAQSLYVRDNRIRDFKLFAKRYPRVEKNKILISSRAFLDPASARNEVFDAYTSCNIDGYGLTSKKRLPSAAEKFRVLRVASKEEKISRIDGYRLKYKINDGPIALNMKVELSDASQYISDKKIIGEWIENIKSTVSGFNVEYRDKGYFSEYQVSTNVLDEKRMVYMVVMLDDTLQMVTNISFINPPEYMRQYQTAGEFLPDAKKIVNAFQGCVVDNLNKNF